MTKTKSQLRTEALYRLVSGRPFDTAEELVRAAVCGLKGVPDADALIYLLEDECEQPCYTCSKLAELMAEVGALRAAIDGKEPENDVAAEQADSDDGNADSRDDWRTLYDGPCDDFEPKDTRKKLEDDVLAHAEKAFYGDGTLRTSNSHMRFATVDDVLGWLDRQAAITEREWNGRRPTDYYIIDRKLKEFEEENGRLRELLDENAEIICKSAMERTAAEKRVSELESENEKLMERCCIYAEIEAENEKLKEKVEEENAAMNKATGNWCKADDKARYWKSEVEECLKAARIESVSEGVMAYPRHEGYTAPSLLVQSQFDYLDQLCVDLQAKLDEMAERKCPGYEPERHYCRYHNQDFELNHQTVSRLKRENAILARDLGECMAERDELIAEIDALEYRGDLDEPRGTKVDINGEVAE